MTRAVQVLVVDDEPSIGEVLKIVLSKEGYEVLTSERGAEALQIVESRPVDCVIQDLKMPGMDGITLLSRIKETHPRLPIIVITAFSSWDTAVEAMRLGAYDYIKKPFDNDTIRAVVARALEQKRLSELPDAKQVELRDIIGNSEQIQKVRKLVERIAATDATVLISGESGSGKELVARSLHYNSLRNSGPFISINCGAFTENLLESELFGHVRGAFTGAVAEKKGLFTVADGGTIFLDEVGDLSPETQIKLLRVLQEREFERLGGTATLQVDVRVIAATNRDLEALLADGTFREDLYYRLNVFPIHVPPLRDRRADILLLADHFVEHYSRRNHKYVARIATPAIDMLMSYHWPGNVRELENCIERAILLATGDVLHAHHLPPTLQMPSATAIQRSGTLPAILDDIERDLIIDALKASGGNKAKAARALGLSERLMGLRVRKHGIDPKRFRSRPARRRPSHGDRPEPDDGAPPA